MHNPVGDPRFQVGPAEAGGLRPAWSGPSQAAGDPPALQRELAGAPPLGLQGRDDRLVMRLLSEELESGFQRLAGVGEAGHSEHPLGPEYPPWSGEQEQHELQQRLDRQQGVYARDAFLKHRLLRFMRKANHQLSSRIRDYRQAVSDLDQVSREKDPTMIRVCLSQLMIAAGDLAGSLREMLGMVSGMRTLDREVHGAGQLVDKSELGRGGATGNLSASLQMQIALRVPEAVDEHATLELGHWEMDWSADSVRSGLELLGSGLELARRSLGPEGQGERSQEVTLRALSSERQKLTAMLTGLTAIS